MPVFHFFVGVGANFFGEILQPQGGAANGQMAGNGTTPSGKLVSGDLDASLANLTSNLNLNSGHGKWVLFDIYLGWNWLNDSTGSPLGSNAPYFS